MSGCGCEMTARNDAERKTLWLVLGINALMFVVELSLGLWAQSTGLIADSLDMLADASVYGIGLYAVGKSAGLKIKSARVSGIVQIALALWVLLEVLHKAWFGSEPMSALMMAVGLLALVANWICLTQIAKHQDDGVHMRASYIFSKNDVIANLGVIIAGVLVWLTDSRYPDLVIGLIIALVVLRGGMHILREAKQEECDEAVQKEASCSAVPVSLAAVAATESSSCCGSSVPEVESSSCCGSSAPEAESSPCCGSSAPEAKPSNAAGCCDSKSSCCG